MTPQDLIAAFDVIAEAPDGVKRLRELVLQLAVRGKLVPQDPRTVDPRIEDEGRLQRAGSDADAGDFEIPRSWQWRTVGACCSYVRRGRSPIYDDKGQVPVVSQKCVQWSGFDITRVRFIADDSIARYEEPQFLREGDLLWNSTGHGTVGRIIPFRASEMYSRVVADSHVTILRPSECASKYLWLWLAGPVIQSKIDALVSGSTKQTELATKTIVGLPVPVPPLAEQHRIVKRVDELMSLLDRLEAARNARDEARRAARDAALAALRDAPDPDAVEAAWSRIAHDIESLLLQETDVACVHDAILQLAVQGRLVRQHPQDPDISKTLERARTHRLVALDTWSRTNSEGKTILRKLAAQEQPVPPYSIPRGWACVSLLDASFAVVDCHNKTAPYAPDGVPILRTTNVRAGEIVWRDMRFVNDSTYEKWSHRCPPEPGDIIFTREAPMGEAAIIPNGLKLCLGQRTMLIRPFPELASAKYLLIALLEPGVRKRAQQTAVGATVQHLRVGDVEGLPIMLPPLAEQHRIVAKVDELMALCDALEARLTTARDLHAQLAAAAVHHLDVT